MLSSPTDNYSSILNVPGYDTYTPKKVIARNTQHVVGRRSNTPSASGTHMFRPERERASKQVQLARKKVQLARKKGRTVPNRKNTKNVKGTG